MHMQTCTAGGMCICDPLIYGWAIEGGAVVNVIYLFLKPHLFLLEVSHAERLFRIIVYLSMTSKMLNADAGTRVQHCISLDHPQNVCILNYKI